MSEFKATQRQIDIVMEVLKAADEGLALSFEELKQRVPGTAEISPQAFRLSLRILDKYGYISKNYRDGKKSGRMKISPTLLAYQTFRQV